MPLRGAQLEGLAFTAPTPLHAHFRAEVAAVWMKAGQLGQAMAEFEAVEDWERLIGCYMVTGAAACLT